MINLRLCETARPLFKHPSPNYKSSRLQDCSTCSEPEIPRLLFRMLRFRDWADIFRDASLSHRPFYTPQRHSLICSWGFLTYITTVIFKIHRELRQTKYTKEKSKQEKKKTHSIKNTNFFYSQSSLGGYNGLYISTIFSAYYHQ